MNFKKRKVAWVTGASSGIGKALSLKLSDEDWNLALTSRRVEELQKLSGDLKTDNIIAPADVSNINELSLACDNIFNKFETIDLCVLNAGIYKSVEGGKINSSIFNEHMQVNYMGVVNALELILPKMIKNKYGHIIIVSSPTGWRGLPRATAYGPTKAALKNLAESLRYSLELHNIRIQLVSPGFVKTEATPVNEHSLPGIISSEKAALHIINAIKSKSFEVIIPNTVMLWALYCLKYLPENIAHKILKWKIGV